MADMNTLTIGDKSYEVADKTAREALETKAEKTEIPDLSGYAKTTDIPSIPSKLSELEADATHRTVTDAEKAAWSGKAETSDIPATLPNPNALTFTGAATGSYDGSAAKTVNIPTVPTSLKNPNKLTFTGAVSAEYDGSSAKTVNIPKVVVDSALSATSENPVQNKAVVSALAKKADTGDIPDLTGYAKTTDIPEVPSKVSELENDAGYVTADAIPASATVDSELSTTSTNAVQNKVIAAALANKADATAIPDLSGYAKTTDIPTVPSVLPNPYALTFTGAVSATYDGSEAQTVEIPAAYDATELESRVSALETALENYITTTAALVGGDA